MDLSSLDIIAFTMDSTILFQIIILFYWLYKIYIKTWIYNHKLSATFELENHTKNSTRSSPELTSARSISISPTSNTITTDLERQKTPKSLETTTSKKNIISELKKIKKLPKKSKVYTTLSILFTTIYGIFLVSYDIYLKYTSQTIVFTKVNNRILYGLFLMYFSRLMLNSYYLHRIKISFQKSNFEMKHATYKKIKFALFLSFLLFGFSGLIFIIFMNEINVIEYNPHTQNLLLMIATLWDSFWGIFLFVLFFKRLKLFIKLSKNSDNFAGIRF